MNTSIFDVFEALEADNSRLFKEQLLRSHVDNRLLMSTFTAVMDPYVDYGVRKFKMPPAVHVNNDDSVIDNFVNLVLPPLENRKLTGNSAREWIEQAFAAMDQRQQKWCRRILLRNLRMGVKTSTVNKVWPDLIPGFSVQLANTLGVKYEKDGIVITDDVSYPVRVEPKLDGLRLVAVKRNGKVTFHTRNGNILETLPQIRKALEDAKYDNIVLDGESMGRDWNESASVMHASKNMHDDSNMVYNVFDAMDVKQWDAQSCPLTLSERQNVLSEVVDLIGNPMVAHVPHVIANNETELMDYYETQLDLGFEGVMLKDVQGLYTFDRSKAMLKMKPMTTYEGTVVAWYEGREDTKLKGIFGGFHMLLSNGVITRVGGGFSDAVRKEFTAKGCDSYVGKIIEVKGQPPLTKDGRIRFPVFQRFRDLRDVDPLVHEAYENHRKNVL